MHYSRHRLTVPVITWLLVNQWQMGSPCLPIGQFVKNYTVSV